MVRPKPPSNATTHRKVRLRGKHVARGKSSPGIRSTRRTYSRKGQKANPTFEKVKKQIDLTGHSRK